MVKVEVYLPNAYLMKLVSFILSCETTNPKDIFAIGHMTDITEEEVTKIFEDIPHLKDDIARAMLDMIKSNAPRNS